MIVFISIIISLTGILYLSASDPKRRRTFKLDAWGNTRPVGKVLLGIFLPGCFLMLVEHYAGFVMWMASLSVFGWVIVAIPPSTYRLASDALKQKLNWK